MEDEKRLLVSFELSGVEFNDIEDFIRKVFNTGNKMIIYDLAVRSKNANTSPYYADAGHVVIESDLSEIPLDDSYEEQLIKLLNNNYNAKWQIGDKILIEVGTFDRKQNTIGEIKKQHRDLINDLEQRGIKACYNKNGNYFYGSVIPPAHDQSDGLHPNAAGHEILRAELIYKYTHIKRELTSKHYLMLDLLLFVYKVTPRWNAIDKNIVQLTRQIIYKDSLFYGRK